VRLARYPPYSAMRGLGARIAQLVKAWICNLRVAGLSFTAGGVFFRYGFLASLSLDKSSQISARDV